MDIDLDRLRELMGTLADHDITEFEHESGDERIRIRRGPGAPEQVITTMGPALSAHSGASPSAPPPPPSQEASEEDSDPDVVFVTSPFVGTFYRAPSPDADPFVQLASSVSKGQTLCIVEAMKLMNEIEADFACSIEEVLVDNGKPVEYGDRLFRVRKR